jgi:hypothetical protein
MNEYGSNGPCDVFVLTCKALFLRGILECDGFAHTEQNQANNIVKGARGNQRSSYALGSAITELVPSHQLWDYNSRSN